MTVAHDAQGWIPSMKAEDTHDDIIVVGQVATDLIFSIWACCKGQSTSSISTYYNIPVRTGMYLYVLVHTSGGPDPHQAHS